VKLLLSGYFGYGNSGDEATLAVLTRRLPRVLEQAELTVLSHSLEETRRNYGVPAVQRMNPLAVFQAIRRCDLLIFGGGSLLQNATSNRSLLYYLALIGTANRLGKPVVLLSQGIGPLNGAWAKRAAARGLRSVAGLTLRDELSRKALMDLGIPAEQLTVTGDLALLLDAEKSAPIEGKESNLVAVIPGPGCGQREKRELVRILDWLQEKGKQVVLLPLFPAQDLPLCRELAQACPGTVLLEEAEPTAQCAKIGTMELVVSVRLHGLVYAAEMGVPMVGISYDPKVEGFLREMGCWDGLTVENLTLERFQTAYAQAADSTRRTKTAQGVAQAKLALEQQEIWLKSLAESGGEYV
jgi:polysaccharide pyruvyl transferase CsaB